MSCEPVKGHNWEFSGMPFDDDDNEDGDYEDDEDDDDDDVRDGKA